MNIFIARNNQNLGPFDLDAVNAKLLTGELSPHDLAWTAGQSTWQPLQSLPGVQVPDPSQVPPPPPQGLPPQGPLPLPSPQIPGNNYPGPTTPMPPYPGGPQAPGGYPPGTHPGPGYPGGVPAGAGGSQEEQVIFDVSASPLAVSAADIILGLLCTCGLWLVVPVAVNMSTRYKLTTQRLIARRGLLSQRVEEIELYRVRDVTVEQTSMGRMMGFGNVVVHANDASSPRLLLQKVPGPERIKEQIRTAARQGRRNEGVRVGEYMG